MSEEESLESTDEWFAEEDEGFAKEEDSWEDAPKEGAEEGEEESSGEESLEGLPSPRVTGVLVEREVSGEITYKEVNV